MKALVIGLGSMGKRRIRLLLENKNIEIVGIDSDESRREEAEKTFQIKVFPSVEEALKGGGMTCAFVCTSPQYHANIINECLNNGLHVFSEINLISDGYEENIELARKNNLVLFLSSTFLYREEIELIINKVKESKSQINYMYHVGQYLPDWHPWENYTDFFVSSKRTNGCREIMAIEFPWIVKCFGDIDTIESEGSKILSLELDYNDSYLLKINHKNGCKGLVAIDVVARKPVRRLEIFGEDIFLSWEGTPDTLMSYSITEKTQKPLIVNQDEHKDGYASFIVENPYRNEIGCFLDMLEQKGTKAKWSFEEDLNILNVIDRIEGIV